MGGAGSGRRKGYQPIETTVPTAFEKALAAAPDFTAACRIAARRYRWEAGNLKRLSEAAGVPYDSGFWTESSADADRARLVVEAFLMQAFQKAIARLRSEGLGVFADALESGDYAGELGF